MGKWLCLLNPGAFEFNGKKVASSRKNSPEKKVFYPFQYNNVGRVEILDFNDDQN
jgi:hypothetical protein